MLCVSCIATLAVARVPSLAQNATRQAVLHELSFVLAGIFGDTMRLDYDDQLNHIAQLETELNLLRRENLSLRAQIT